MEEERIKTPKESAYLRLYRELRRDIVSGAYAYGARLPSKRALSLDRGVSVVTVEHAYTLLCEEGYAESRERSGYYAAYREGDTLPGADAPAPIVPDGAQLRSGRVSIPFSVLSRTMRRVLSVYGERILVRSPNNGLFEARSAIAAYLARSRGVYVSPEQIVLGAGAEYLYSLVAQLVGSDAVFALESPSYEMIRRVYAAAGIRTEALPLGPDGILSSALEQSGALVLHVTPFHSFPSGVTASASKRREYLRWAEKRGGLIVEDDFDSELTVSTKAEDTVFSLDTAGRVIYMNTFSRTLAPSMRIGYMVLPEALLEPFNAKLGFYSCSVPVFEQYVLAELLTNGDFERHVNRVRRSRRRESAEE